MIHDTIIIGAGPAGLYAAYLLAKSGQRCLILEARSRTGGRACTIRTPYAGPIETGAEFVHGRVPLSLQLLSEAGLSYTEASGQWVSVKGGLAAPDDEGPQWDALMKALQTLEDDITLKELLETRFGDSRYASLRDRAISFAEGYDSADTSRISAKALAVEWGEEDPTQFRINGGYSVAMDYLIQQIRAAGSEIRLDTEVSYVESAAGRFTLRTGDNAFEATQVIVAAPLGVLQSGRLRIGPGAAAFQDVFNEMGFGDVIKFALVCREPFWEARFPDMGFLMSGADIPTWWTQAPTQSNVLTGWLAGRPARARAALSTEMLQEMALNSLATLFSRPVEVLEAELLESHIFNWSGDPLTGGAYAYETPEAAAARRTLAEMAPAGLSFIGEYAYAGPSMGTVEAAFRSAATCVAALADLH